MNARVDRAGAQIRSYRKIDFSRKALSKIHSLIHPFLVLRRYLLNKKNNSREISDWILGNKGWIAASIQQKEKGDLGSIPIIDWIFTKKDKHQRATTKSKRKPPQTSYN